MHTYSKLQISINLKHNWVIFSVVMRKIKRVVHFKHATIPTRLSLGLPMFTEYLNGTSVLENVSPLEIMNMNEFTLLN